MKKRVNSLFHSLTSHQPQQPLEKPKETRPTPSNRGHIFWELMRVYDYYLLSLLIKNASTTSMEFWDSILDLLEEAGLIYPILSRELAYEIEHTQQEESLLRANTGATMLLSSYMRKHLTETLEKHMNPIIQSVNGITQAITLDVNNPEDEKHFQTMTELLSLHCMRFLDIENDLPKGFTYLLTVIRNCVKEKYPNSAINSIAVIIFNRLITPSLVSPKNFNSCLINPNDNAKKILVHLTKIYQGFVIQGDTPITYPNLMRFSDTIKSFYEPMNEFLNAISDNYEMPQVHCPPVLSQKTTNNCCDKTSEIINAMNPVLLNNIIKKAIEDDMKVPIGYLMYLCMDDWNKEQLKQVKNPQTLELFEDGIEQTYFKLSEAFELSILMRKKKIDELNVQIFLLRSLIEDYCIENGLDFEEFIDSYRPFKELPLPVYSKENCGLGLLESENNEEWNKFYAQFENKVWVENQKQMNENINEENHNEEINQENEIQSEDSQQNE